MLAIGFGALPEEAALRALLSLQQPELALEHYREGWRQKQAEFLPLDQPHDAGGRNCYRVSTAVLATHRDEASGAVIASLSIPWGFSKGDDDLGGYHLVWPRDLVETAGGQLAAGATTAAKAVLDYLAATQEADGHWAQNSWLDGRPYWKGIQIDETGFPILLYDMLLRAGAIAPEERERYARMIRAAAGYIVRNGPVTQQDRWEEDSGYSAFTIAVEIAALLAAAEAMEVVGQGSIARYLTETADSWNEQIDDWAYARETEISRKLGIDGYYMRIGFSSGDANARSHGLIPIRNRSDGNEAIEAGLLISPDALALVRFGLRAADDPRILNTVTAIDALLRRELPAGPYWYRYNDDGYGEHEDGAPFDGSGIGRLWPLLTGERGALRTRRRQAAGGAAAARNAGGFRKRGRPDPGADLGHRRHPGPRIVLWPALRQRHAAGMGAFRAHQAPAVAAGWRRLRHAAADGQSLYQKHAAPGADRLAARLEGRPHRAGAHPSAGIPGGSADPLVGRQLDDGDRQPHHRDRDRHVFLRSADHRSDA